MLDRAWRALLGMVWPAGDSYRARLTYERAVADFFGTGTALAFWKGRVALYAILKALDIGPGDEVIVPGYTCVMVPGPIVYLGATPVYVDIEPKFYSVPAAAVAERITPRTRAILVQHTYGYPAPVCEIRRLADDRGIAVIEDCCHTFGGCLDGQLLGTFGHAAFFSGQWNKPFSTGLGGLALVHDPALAELVRQEQAGYSAPASAAAFMLAAQLLAYELLVYPRTSALVTRLFRWLTRQGLVIGSSQAAEFESTMPSRYALGPARVQCQLGQLEVGRIARDLEHRRRVTIRYQAELPRLGYAVPAPPSSWDAPLLRFPIRVANKAETLARAASFGVEIGSWFECPLHPAETDQAAFGYRDGCCPVAEKAAAQVINLPTHRRVSDADIERTLDFVRGVCRPAEP